MSIIIHKFSRQKKLQTIRDRDCGNSSLPVVEDTEKLTGKVFFSFQDDMGAKRSGKWRLANGYPRRHAQKRMDAGFTVGKKVRVETGLWAKRLNSGTEQDVIRCLRPLH
ncbi:hypothetical protein [Pararhizobium sp.]|uniref:hypothetical protein n=1 Tax=Pararhizobium sp. TaxID=1977563 RepID=UPI003D13A6A4